MNKILDQIDAFIETQKESEQKLLLFLPVLLFGFLSYYFLYPITDENLNNAINENKKITQKISKIKQQNNNLKNNNLKLLAVLKKANKILKDLKSQKQDIDVLVNKLKFLRFDMDKWANFYDKIPTLAKKYNLVILNLDNRMFLENNKQLISKKMECTIQVKGDFKDFMKFMHSFENKKEFVKVKSFTIDKNDMVFTIYIYGAQI